MAHIPTEQIDAIHNALAEFIRVKLIRLLLDRELCVCELVGALEEPQYKVSRHLAILKSAGLVQDRRSGTWIFYSLDPNLPVEWKQALLELSKVWDYNHEIQLALHRINTIKFRPESEDCAVNSCVKENMQITASKGVK